MSSGLDFEILNAGSRLSRTTQEIKQDLLAPQQNLGKDECIVDLKGHESQYWLETESGLLGAFKFEGACTTGDGS